MHPPIKIRRERPEDHPAIFEVTRSAFETMPYSNGQEQHLVTELRLNGALTLSMVATLDDRVVGHIAFSPATSPEGCGEWYALGPVSVLPAHQKMGIGSKLIQLGLEQLQALGAAGCILVGDPGYYRRFGFEVTPHLAPVGQPQEYFMVKGFRATELVGPVDFHPVFYSGSDGMPTTV